MRGTRVPCLIWFFLAHFHEVIERNVRYRTRYLPGVAYPRELIAKQLEDCHSFKINNPKIIL